ncbi:MAG: DUF58 domain-containing protein [Dictyoglomaceae bacterium]
MRFRVNFTLLGFFLLLGNILITLIGINVGSNPLIFMSSFIYALYIFNFLELIFYPFFLELELIAPFLVEENTEEVVVLRIKNNSFFPRRKFYILWEGEYIPGEIGKEEKYFILSCIFKKRGIKEFKNIWLKFTGTFGLCYIKRHYPLNSKTLVYPTFYQLYKELIILGDSGYSASTLTLSSQGEEFHSLRKYISGDPLRIIAWKASAKRGELLSKQFERLLRFEPIFLLDNLVPEIDNITIEEFDQLLRFVHSLVLPYIKQGLRVKIRTLYPKDIFIPQSWDDLKIFLANLELKKGKNKEDICNENFDLVFSLDYKFWKSKNCLQKRFVGVEFHKENLESSLSIFRKKDNPYDFLNLWGTKNE